MGGELVGSDRWHQLLRKPLEPVHIDVLRSLTAPDIEDLIDAFRRGSRDEELLTFGVLSMIALRPEEFPEVPWSPAALAQFTDALDEKARAGERPWLERLTPSMRTRWVQLAGDRALDFLLTVPISELEPRARKETLELLAMKARGNERARERLDEIASGGGDVADSARDALERVGIVSPSRLEHWASRWRNDKDPEALNWLYYHWIDFLPVGFSKSEVLRVLGEPDDGDGSDFYYISGDTHIYLEMYDEQGLTGWHLA